MNTFRPKSHFSLLNRQILAGAIALFAAGIAVANTPAPAAPKADAAKGAAVFGASCASCHGADGNSAIPANPKLAGQHAAYLNKQLTEFKSGKRANPIMSGMVAALSPEDMLNISAWAASQKPASGIANDKELAKLGEKIYRGGVPDRQIAACSGCHSPNGAGIPAQYPRLSGQNADYVTTQLNEFRNGNRKNSLQMTQVAAKLNDREIKAVAEYIAGLR